MNGQPRDRDLHPPTIKAADGKTDLHRYDVAAVIYRRTREEAESDLLECDIHLEDAEVIDDVDGPDPVTRVLWGLLHPIKVATIETIYRTDEPISPAIMALLLGQDVNKVAYHVRYLAEHGALVEVKTEQRRGATEHYYRLVTS